VLAFNVSFTTSEEEKEQSVASPLTFAERMLEQNETSKWMQTLLGAIVEPKVNSMGVSANDSRVANECPKGQPIDTGYPAQHSIPFFCKKNHNTEQRKLFSIRMLSMCILAEYHLAEAVSSSTGPVYGATPYACKRFWKAQTKNNV
jgi:hypothetical protein